MDPILFKIPEDYNQRVGDIWEGDDNTLEILAIDKNQRCTLRLLRLDKTPYYGNTDGVFTIANTLRGWMNYPRKLIYRTPTAYVVGNELILKEE